MKAFRDTEGREWLIAIHVAQHKRVRDLTGVDLYGLVDNKFEGLSALLGDPAQFVDVLYVLCRDQAEKRGLSDWDFGSAMAGDAILSARDAFLAELGDFFPDPRVRAGFAKLIETSRKYQEMSLDRLAEMAAKIDPEAEARRLMDSSGAAPESSGSTPDHSRSAS
jgi:hypothetical protein